MNYSLNPKEGSLLKSTKNEPFTLQQIENSCPMDYSLTTDGLLSSVADDFYHKLLPHFYSSSKKEPSKAKQRQLRTNVNVAIANLFRVFVLGEVIATPEANFYLSVDKKKKVYSDIPDRYKSKDITYVYFVDKVINLAVELGLIEQCLGYKPEHASKKGYRTRIRAIGWLLDSFEEIYQLSRYDIHKAELTTHLQGTEVIRLKDEEKKLIDYVDTHQTEQMRASLERYNEYLNTNVRISLNGHNIVTGMSLYRVFNNSSFDQGGRFFGGYWQTLPSIERPLLCLNGEPTIELDYASLHLIVLYNLKLNRDVPEGDLYCLSEYGIGKKGDKLARKVSKLGALIVFNSADKQSAMASLNDKLRKMRKQGYFIPWNAKEIIEAFMEKHKELSDFFCTAHGLELQRIDSTIVDQILIRSVDDDIPVLPVHDSFIVRERDQKWLLDSMKSEYKKITGFMPKVHAA